MVASLRVFSGKLNTLALASTNVWWCVCVAGKNQIHTRLWILNSLHLFGLLFLYLALLTFLTTTFLIHREINILQDMKGMGSVATLHSSSSLHRLGREDTNNSTVPGVNGTSTRSSTPENAKRIKLQPRGSTSATALNVSSSSHSLGLCCAVDHSKSRQEKSHPDPGNNNGKVTPTTHLTSSHEQVVSPDRKSNSTSTIQSNGSAKDDENNNVEKDKRHTVVTSAPPKATHFLDLRKQYYGELQYMLIEFQKLEKQLLVARSASVETDASRERREKLHSFIEHLQETMNEIDAHTVAKDEDHSEDNPEAVQKLEEHILANLLPVKNRLKKQLAAQKGARHNPAGMPRRVGYNAADGSVDISGSHSNQGEQGTFALAAQQRKQKQQTVASAAAPDTHRNAPETQFGKPLKGGGSSLTQKLHGTTLGSSERKYGHGVGYSSKDAPGDSTTQQPKKLVAGLAIGSDQGKSSMAAASSVHQVVIKEPALLELARNKSFNFFNDAVFDESEEISLLPQIKIESLPELNPSILSEEETRRLRRKRRKLHKQKKARSTSNKKKQRTTGTSTVANRQAGPRPVEYLCSLCNEAYQSTCDYNPWWALSRHECPKCQKVQIPRLDISSSANAIEYHPALLAHMDDNGVATAPPPTPPGSAEVKNEEPENVGNDLESASPDSASGESSFEDLDNISTDDEGASELSDDDSVSLDPLTPAEQAEHERFGEEYSGPKLGSKEAAKLLVLMEHASACKCTHTSPAHREVCLSTKFLMLHVRDCPGTTLSYDVCPFPWCRKVKHLLYHLVSCRDPTSCEICAPTFLSANLQKLKELNKFGLAQVRELCQSACARTLVCPETTLAAASSPVKKEETS